MGVIAYEISKRRPASIHGLDRFRRAVTVARRIFMAIDTPSRFDVVDFFDDRRLVSLLAPKYDVVLLMAVWQHVYQANPAKAERFLSRLVERCGDVIVFRGPLEWEQHFTSAIARHGFVLSYVGPRRERQIAPIVTFRRAAG